MKNVYTVGQVNSYIKNMFAQDFMLNRLYVKGEVSNCKYHTSGHLYFSLKDESGTIACVMFAGNRSGLSFRLADGQQVIVLGSVSVYERSGQYQLYAREIIQDGRGALYEKYEALKKELEEMGMFAPEYKRPVPRYIRTLGVVTAPTGAAVRDIINIAQRRNYPAQVQGEGAKESIVRGIREMEKLRPDVIIVGRGGGSIEDLWAFNERCVARAIFGCSVPVISAVGHETDTTIADFAADLRAPTPSAAAELAVYDIRDALERISGYRKALADRMNYRISAERSVLEQLRMRLKAAHPRQKLLENRQYSADLENRLRQRMETRLEREKHRLAICIEKLKGLSPLDRLSRGYSYVTSESGENIRSTDQARPGMKLYIYVKDGRYSAEVTAPDEWMLPGSEEK